MSNAFLIVCGIILVLVGGSAWVVGNIETDKPLYFNWLCGAIVLLGVFILAYSTGGIE